MSELLPNSSVREIAGWGATGAAWAAPQAPSLSRAIAQAFHDAGVRDAFGLLGGGIAPFAAGLRNTAIRFFHFRHEAGAGFAAIESYFATRRPALVVVTTGPGLFNVLNAAMGARVDGAKLVVVSGFTSRHQIGRGAVQETSSHTMPADLTRPGSIFHDVAIPETEEELTNAMGRILRGLAAPGGFVAHLGLPLALQTKLLASPRASVAPTSGEHSWTIDAPSPSQAAIDACLLALADPSAALWVGHGALGARETLVRFAEEASLPVITSPRAKGLFPENHPLLVGVSGAGGSPDVQRFFSTWSPRHVLVVGTRLGEVTSFLSPGLTPTESWIHVDLDATAFGAAFPSVQGRGIIADAKRFFEALQVRAMETDWLAQRRVPGRFARSARQILEPRETGRVRPIYLMQALQEAVVEQTDAVVMSESGTAFTWCNTYLRFEEPGRYRTSATWGSMGHFTTGCIGAALSGSRRVVAVVGDGAMLMNNEINTAVQYGADVLWIVLNDAQLGLNEHGMAALGMTPVETQMPATDFVAFARSQGADGSHVTCERELAGALAEATTRKGPFVLDIAIDGTIPSPVVAERIRSLKRQGGVAEQA
jgi:acetolactate synthase-1/2/3 large subunit